MKAAIVTAVGKTPIYGDFENPVAKEGEEIISVHAAALSNLTKSRASGAHYSSDGIFPAVAGTDGVGRTQDGRRVYFAMPEAPFGSLAEYCPIHTRRCVDIPDGLGDITAEVNAGDTVIIDGNHGVVIINPDEQTILEQRESGVLIKTQGFFQFAPGGQHDLVAALIPSSLQCVLQHCGSVAPFTIVWIGNYIFDQSIWALSMQQIGDQRQRAG